MDMSSGEDLEHPNQADPKKRIDPFVTPEAVLAGMDGTEVINAKRESHDLRELAELAGGPVEQLKEE